MTDAQAQTIGAAALELDKAKRALAELEGCGSSPAWRQAVRDARARLGQAQQNFDAAIAAA